MTVVGDVVWSKMQVVPVFLYYLLHSFSSRLLGVLLEHPPTNIEPPLLLLWTWAFLLGLFFLCTFLSPDSAVLLLQVFRFVKHVLFFLHVEVVLNEQFFLLKTVGKFGLILKHQHFEAFECFVDNLGAFGGHDLDKVFFEEGLLVALLDVDEVAHEEGVLLGLQPDVVAQLRHPQEVGVFQDNLVQLLVLEVVVDGHMLLTPVQVVLQLHPPPVHCLNNVDCHVPQPRHVHEDPAQHTDGVTN